LWLLDQIVCDSAIGAPGSLEFEYIGLDRDKGLSQCGFAKG